MTKMNDDDVNQCSVEIIACVFYGLCGIKDASSLYNISRLIQQDRMLHLTRICFDLPKQSEI